MASSSGLLTWAAVRFDLGPPAQQVNMLSFQSRQPAKFKLNFVTNAPTDHNKKRTLSEKHKITVMLEPVQNLNCKHTQDT